MIDELLGDETNGLTIGPDRHYNLGGPFIAVRGYLRAYIRSSFSALAKQQGIDEYKGRYLGRIEEFIDRIITQDAKRDMKVSEIHSLDVGDVGRLGKVLFVAVELYEKPKKWQIESTQMELRCMRYQKRTGSRTSVVNDRPFSVR